MTWLLLERFVHNRFADTSVTFGSSFLMDAISELS